MSFVLVINSFNYNKELIFKGLFLPSQKQIELETDHYYFKFLISFPLIFCVLRIFNLYFLYRFDTPYQLIYENKIEKAKEVLKIIYKDQYVEHIYKEILFKIESNKG